MSKKIKLFLDHHAIKGLVQRNGLEIEPDEGFADDLYFQIKIEIHIYRTRKKL